MQFNEISGGLEGGAEPPAFQRAERERMKREKAQEKMRGSSVVSDELFSDRNYKCCYNSIIMVCLPGTSIIIVCLPST